MMIHSANERVFSAQEVSNSTLASPVASAADSNATVRVVVRIRPMNADEERKKYKTSLYPVWKAHPEMNSTANDRLDTPGNNNASKSRLIAGAAPTSSKKTSPSGSGVFAKFSPLRTALSSHSRKKSALSPKSQFFNELLTSHTGCETGGVTDHTPLISNIHHSIGITDDLVVSSLASPNKASSPSLSSSGSISPYSHHFQRLMAESQLSGSRSFDFHAVFPPTATQQQVYERTMGDTIQRNIQQGFHTTIIAYGQTGSGKTYTMSGPKASRALSDDSNSSLLSTPRSAVLNRASRSITSTPTQQHAIMDEDGVITRAIRDVFLAKQRREASLDVSISMSCIEVYNDELRDLLVQDDLQQPASAPTPPRLLIPSLLKLRDQGHEGAVSVHGLTELVVNSVQQVQELMDRAIRKRTTTRTKLNERSSRSHAIYTLVVTSTSRQTVNIQQQEIVQLHHDDPIKSISITSKLTLVDLAGSERIKESGVIGSHQKESININKDLFVLGKVVSALAEKKTHVPYRDSKLTRLLRDSLGGNCFTVLIACVSPADAYIEESINTLRYAERTQAIKQYFRPNMTETTDADASFRAENYRLRAEIGELRRRLAQRNEYGRRTAEDQFRSNNNANNFSGLQAKLRRAEEEARAARDNSHSMALKATRLRERYGGYTELAETDGASTVELSEFSIAGDSVTGSLGYVSQGGSTSKERGDVFATFASLKAEINQLSTQKTNLENQVFELTNKLAEAIVQREHDEREMENALSQLRSQRLLEETKIKELQMTANMMQQQVLILEGTLKTDRTRQASFASILRSLSGDHAESDMELEMQPIRQSQHALVAEKDKERIKVLESLLEKEKLRSSELEQHLLSLETELKQSDFSCPQIHTRSAPLQHTVPENRMPTALIGLSDQSHLAVKIPEADGVNECTENEENISPDVVNAAISNIEDDNDSRHRQIRSHAEKMLDWADRVIERGRLSGRSVCSSILTSPGRASSFTLYEPFADATADVLGYGRPPMCPLPESQVIISNMEEVGQRPLCGCETSMFAGNAEHVEFFLPKLGVACSCGAHKIVQPQLQGTDPCALENILRKWQVEFLHSMGIYNTFDFIHASKQRASELAKSMRDWRQKNHLTKVKTNSCRVAIHIWSRTCKTYVKSVREQRTSGEDLIRRPAFMDVSLASDTGTLSTLGFGSTCFGP